VSDTYYKVTGGNPHTNWTTEVVLERDEETGEVTKSVEVGVPIKLNAEDRKALEKLGFTVESSSAKEAEEVAESGPAPEDRPGGDVAAEAPVFGSTAGEPNQTTETPQESQSGSRKNR